MVPTKFLNSNPLRPGWVAGLIEGEGCIELRGKRRPSVVVAMTDKDVIERLCGWAGVGYVKERASRTVSGKQVYIWSVTKRDDAGALLEAILPLLGERRAAKAEEAIQAWRSHPTRGTAPTCGRGHELDASNLYLVDGRRRCRRCAARRQREYRERLKQAA